MLCAISSLATHVPAFMHANFSVANLSTHHPFSSFVSFPCPFAEAQRNEPQEIQKLIDGGLDPSVANGVGQTALHVACLWGTHKCVAVLIKAGAKVSLRRDSIGSARERTKDG